MGEVKKRTVAQNNALHLWLGQVAEVLNQKGLDQHVVIEALSQRGLDLPWTQRSVKENIWKPIQKKMIGWESTTQAATTDYHPEYIGLCKWFAQEFGVQLPPWPDRFRGD